MNGSWFNTKNVWIWSVSLLLKIKFWFEFSFQRASNSFHMKLSDTDSSFVSTNCNYIWLLWRQREATRSFRIPVVHKISLCGCAIYRTLNNPASNKDYSFSITLNWNKRNHQLKSCQLNSCDWRAAIRPVGVEEKPEKSFHLSFRSSGSLSLMTTKYTHR